MMFGVLDRYIGRNILHTILMTLFMLVSLSGIIKFIEQLRKIGEGSYSVLGAGIYTLLSVPKDIEIFFPMAALLGVLFGLGTLASRSELIVMQASGFTRTQIASAVMKTAIPLVLLTMVIGEWVAPLSERIASDYRTKMIFGGAILTTQSGLWARDGENFFYINHILNDNTLSGVNIYHIDQENRLLSVRYAATATFKDNVWQLSQVDESDLSDAKKINGSKTLTGEWKSNLTPDKLGIVSVDPDSLPISGLRDYIQYLKQNKQESLRYQLIMWNKIFSPLSVAVMMLVALSFIFGPLRTVTMGVRVMVGIAVGFLFYVLNQIFGPLSLVYKMHPVIGALLPSLLFLLVSWYLLLKRG